jgi:hypothetical protein
MPSLPPTLMQSSRGSMRYDGDMSCGRGGLMQTALPKKGLVSATFGGGYRHVERLFDVR